MDQRDQTLLYYRTREALRRLDADLGVHALACLTRAVIADGIAYINRDGDVAFLCPKESE